MSEVRAIMGDCLDVMPTLDAGSVSLIVSDPPYHRVKDCEWDRQWATDADYLDWIGRLCGEWRKLMRPNGSLYVFASPRMAARVECKVGETFDIINRITWRKPEFGTKAEMNSKECQRGYFPVSEAIIFAEQSLDETVQYLREECEAAGITPAHLSGLLGFKETQGSIGPRRYLSAAGFAPIDRGDYATLREKTGRFSMPYDDLYRPFSVDDQCQYTDVWDFPTVAAMPGKHPCQKPLSMYEHIIRASSRPGDLVLDPFAGSGVTAEACRRLGRDCILIERDPHWFARLGRPHMAGPAPSRKPRKVEEMPLFAETTP